MGAYQRAVKAINAMKDMGFSEKRVKPILKNLLRLYDKNWDLIEADHYTLLVDAIFEQENEEEPATKNEEEEQLNEESTEPPLKKMCLRGNTDDASTSAELSLRRSMEEGGDLPIAQSIEHDPLLSQLMDKDVQKSLALPSTLTRPDEEEQSQLCLRNRRQTNGLIIPKSEPPEDCSLFEVPIAVMPPISSQGITDIDRPSTSNGSAVLLNGVESLASSDNHNVISEKACETVTRPELATVPEMPLSFEIASSPLGEVKICLSCSESFERPGKQVPSLDEVLKAVEDKCLRSYRILDPNFSIMKLFQETCQSFLDLGSEQDMIQLPRIFSDGSSNDQPSAEAVLMLEGDDIPIAQCVEHDPPFSQVKDKDVQEALDFDLLVEDGPATSNGFAVPVNGIEALASNENGNVSSDKTCETIMRSELATVPEMPLGFEIASSPLGEVKICLSCSESFERPRVHVPSLDEVLKAVEDKCLRSYRILNPNFSIMKLFQETCQSFLDLSSQQDRIQLPTSFCDGSSDDQPSAQAVLMLEGSQHDRIQLPMISDGSSYDQSSAEAALMLEGDDLPIAQSVEHDPLLSQVNDYGIQETLTLPSVLSPKEKLPSSRQSNDLIMPKSGPPDDHSVFEVPTAIMLPITSERIMEKPNVQNALPMSFSNEFSDDQPSAKSVLMLEGDDLPMAESVEHDQLLSQVKENDVQEDITLRSVFSLKEKLPDSTQSNDLILPKSGPPDDHSLFKVPIAIMPPINSERILEKPNLQNALGEIGSQQDRIHLPTSFSDGSSDDQPSSEAVLMLEGDDLPIAQSAEHDLLLSQVNDSDVQEALTLPSVLSLKENLLGSRQSNDTIMPKSEPTDDHSLFEVPIAIMPPINSERSVGFVEDGHATLKDSTVQVNGVESLASKESYNFNNDRACEVATGSELAVVPESPMSFEIASSPLGEVKISLSCSQSFEQPGVYVPSVDEVLKAVEDKCLRLYRILDPNFSIKKLFQETCQTFLDHGCQQDEFQLPTSVLDGSSNGQPSSA